ncbi:MAG: iron-sulfur cluster carrier protein ApbC [Acidobacteria bacterium]|nr:MAG: iron-sulfur cluster carrier protein ApbC [Acidobacteriota bacterium]
MASKPITEEQVLDSLRTVLDPDLRKDIVSLGMIHDIRICEGAVAFRFVLTTPACPVREQLETMARQAVERIPGVTQVSLKMEAVVPKHKSPTEKKAIEGVSNIVAITSGKGGVGKTTVAVNLACALRAKGARVGLLDCDIYGPNVPIMLGVNRQPTGDNRRIEPIEAHGMKVMSMGFLAQDDTPLIWRGPMLHGVIQQFLYQVAWGELDYLVVDLPPGTGDAQLTIMQSVPLSGGVVVTTPQDVALADARRGVMMFRQVKVEVLGIIENMSYFICPHCHERTDIFSHGGGERTSERYDVPFLGSIPLVTELRIAGDAGKPVVFADPSNPIAQAFFDISERLAARISTVNLV